MRLTINGQGMSILLERLAGPDCPRCGCNDTADVTTRLDESLRKALCLYCGNKFATHRELNIKEPTEDLILALP
jgi:Zn ribbon nucleic-acid-binding protein